jgi:hypothetical protein
VRLRRMPAFGEGATFGVNHEIRCLWRGFLVYRILTLRGTKRAGRTHRARSINDRLRSGIMY